MLYFQKEIETMPRKAMQELQLERLKWIVHYCYDCSPIYRKKFEPERVVGRQPGLGRGGRDDRSRLVVVG